MIIMVMIMTVLKCAIRDFFGFFFNLLTARRTVSMRNPVEITCNASNACHVQHAMCHVLQRNSSTIKFDRIKSYLF